VSLTYAVGKRLQYAPAPEVAAIAARLIDLFHPHLKGVRIEYVFVNEAPRDRGRRVNGRVRVVSGLYAFLATPGRVGEPEPFFCMEITRPVWDVKPAEWRVALVDHELKHCDYDDDADTICSFGHDEEEFIDVAERHGAWNEGLERFAEALDRGRQRQGSEELEGVRRAARPKAKRAPDRIDLRRSAH
jgi:hypothetical protein